MRLSSLLIASAILAVGCTAGSDVSTDEATGREDPSAAQTSLPDSAKLYEGKTFDYWIREARASESREDVGKIVDALVAALESPNTTFVVAALDAMQSIGPKAERAAPTLAAKLHDDVPAWVRIAAADALVAIGEAAVPALSNAVLNGPGFAPYRAALALGNMGPAARGALPALRRAAEEGRPAIRERLGPIIAQIESQEASDVPPKQGGDEVLAGDAAAPEVALPETGTTTDWPQFHGAARDNLCRDSGLMTAWPEGGPPFLWQLEGLGRGYSSISIAGGRVVTMGDRKATDGDEESQFVVAYDLARRDELWATRVGLAHEDGGPRCTPTLAGDSVYALGTDGDLVCVDLQTGKERWRRSLTRDFGGKIMSIWKFTESPLVDGNRVICTPGGKEAALVALDKRTGELLWKCVMPELGKEGKDGAAYSSAVVAEIAGTRQYVQLLGRGLIGVEASSGRFLWGYNRIANSTANITTPVVRDPFVFASTSYGTGSALLRITRNGEEFKADEVYFLGPGEFQNHHGGVVLLGDHIYGGHGQNRGHPICVELSTGKILWKGKAPERGSAAVLYADGHLFFRYDRGLVARVEATPKGFRPRGSFQPLTGNGPAWAHPVIHQGRLYLRHGDLLACYDLRKRP